MTLDDLIEAVKTTALANGFVKSRGEFRRLIDQGAVKLTCDTATNTCVVKIGKRRWFKLTFM